MARGFLSKIRSAARAGELTLAYHEYPGWLERGLVFYVIISNASAVSPVD